MLPNDNKRKYSRLALLCCNRLLTVRAHTSCLEPSSQYMACCASANGYFVISSALLRLPWLGAFGKRTTVPAVSWGIVAKKGADIPVLLDT